jgi:hemoglobin
MVRRPKADQSVVDQPQTGVKPRVGFLLEGQSYTGVVAESTLYERIGGESAIMAAVDGFYERVLEDPLTRPWFEEIDMDKQSRKLVAFMAWAFGGPEEYKGRDIREAHADLVTRGLSDEHFDAVGKHLKLTLEALEVDQVLIDEALVIVESQRDAVLGR